MTDDEGRYSIKVPDNAVLVFSLLGYKDTEVPVAGRAVVNVSLEEDRTILDEVLVVGYGTQRREFVVGSVSQVSSEELLKAPMANAQNMLAGKLSGLTTVQRSGIPGSDNAQLILRGYSSYQNSSPIMLVDGVERGMSYLNPNDIASVTVLKDAATAAIYGVRGANGVILVTTKSGQAGKSSISYDGSVTFDVNTVEPEMLNAQDYVYWHNLARTMDGVSPYWTDERLAQLDALGILGETDWVREVYDKFGLTHQHNLSATGGNEKFRYYASLGYMGQDGILMNCDYERYNFRANIDARLADGLNFSMNISGAHAAQNLPGTSLDVQYAFNPIQMAYYALPIFKTEYNGYPLGYQPEDYSFVPIALLDTGYQKQRRWMAEIRSSLKYDFGRATDVLRGLEASLFFAYNYDQTMDMDLLESIQQYVYTPNTNSLTFGYNGGFRETTFAKSQSIGWNYTVRPQVSYNRDFAGRHNVSALFLFESNKSFGDTMTGNKKNYIEGSPIDLNMGMDDAATPVSGSHYYTGMAAFAGRVSYAYDKKYIVEFSFREDGSYKFAPQNRWGFFPSVALGWVISEEKFFKGKVSWINYLKLRASAGRLGQDDTSAFLYMPSTSPQCRIIPMSSAESPSRVSIPRAMCMTTLPGRGSIPIISVST